VALYKTPESLTSAGSHWSLLGHTEASRKLKCSE